MKPDVATAVRKYRWQFSGMVAHVIQRATGVLLLVYLFLHVLTVNKLSQGPEAFNQALATFKSPLFKVLEIMLLGTVILHALNGIRITLIDLGVGHERQRQLFWVWSVGLGAVIFLAGGIPIFLAGVLKL
ncbi:MAG: succinate dehydrogenase, cytochrome b556 subunit [Planctomycetes bacterium]|nr:succinate dehydrogenase, cytochrome b556 subunit [Planctomycetota bacterium]